SGSTTSSSAIGIVSVPGRDGQAGSFPFGKPVNQSSGHEALPVELTHCVVGIDAVGAAAVGDDLRVLGQGPQMAAQLGDGHRVGAGDVTGLVFGTGTYIQNENFSPLQPRRELLAVDHVDAVALTKVGVREPLEAGDMVG